MRTEGGESAGPDRAGPPHPADDPNAQPPPPPSPEEDAAEAAELQAFKLTDMGNAERLVARHGKDLRYVHLFDCWFVWDGRHWIRDQTGKVKELAKATVRGIPEETKKVRPPKKDNDRDEARYRRHCAAIRRWADKSEFQSRLNAMVALAQSDPAVAALPSQFDTDAWALNLLNGTLDLRGRELRPHRREDFITKLVPVEYDPKAESPRWEQFIKEIFLEDQELISYVRRALGYSLTGNADEQVFFVCYGTGENGKGKLFEVLLGMLGAGGERPVEEGYALTAAIETFSAGGDTGGDKPRPDLVRLKGARVVTCSEQNEDVRLNEALLKQITGCDPLTCRGLNESPITYRPVMKIWIAVNHPPKASESGHGFWRRVRMIPFEYQVPPDKKDAQLGPKLLAEASGILNWLLSGVADWLEVGLGTAKAITDATSAYRSEVDVIGRFIAEQCVVRPEAQVVAGVLYDAYAKWCEANKEKVLTSTAFGRKLTERGFKGELDAAKTRRMRFGIGLRALQETDGSDGSRTGSDSNLSGPEEPELPL